MIIMEDSTSNSDINERIARDSSFLEKVFSWSIDDIFNDDYYSEQVSKIPDSFDTIPEYLNSYVYPLLEETRADLRSSLEIISRAPYAELVSYDKSRHANGKACRDKSFLYDFQIDEWRNRFNDRGKEPYKTLPGDIFVLVKSRPETVYDLCVLAQTWVLASVTRIYKDNSEDDIDDNSSSTFFTVKASRKIGDVDDSYSSLFLVFLMNSTTHKRIWNALHMVKNTRIIQDVIQRTVVDEGCDNSRGSTNNDTLSEDLCTELSASLNHSQYEAVLASLQAMKCKYISQVQLVWGPPGTGKTKTITTLLLFLRKMKVRTLICAPTNVAITEVAGRLLNQILNTSSRDSEETSTFLGDILLFGNKERLRVGSDVEDIYLDYRMKRLAECFAPLTGWRSCFPSLSNFLKDCVSQYYVFVENELIKTREQKLDDVDARVQIEPFLDFFRNRFKAAIEPVRRCITIFFTHFSESYIGEDNIANMLCLINLLDSFENLLLQDDLGSEELLELFSSAKDDDPLVNVVDLSNVPVLEAARRKCISLLRTLYCSLGAFFPNIMSVTELCFQMASLIFCTASSSYKLYTTSMEPLSLLVIDEAAQLKECESAIPLQLPGLQHAILFGDECQLPAMVQSNLSKDANFGRSLFQRLSLLGRPKHLLNVQYRMHPAISSFPNAEFYFQQISDAPSVRGKQYERQYLPGLMYGPYSFINISEGREEFDDDGRSRRNLVEAAVVAKVLHNLHKAWRHSTQRLAIGVISPYAAQVVAIEEMLGRRYEKLKNFGVKVKTVDGFQGGEEDIVIISTVRSNTTGDVGFISSPQRTNVALTRARHCLWVLGNERTLLKSDSIWKKLVCNARERRCFFNADEDKSLTDAMIDIKKELNQLDDLLNKDSVLFKSAKWKSFSKLPSNRAKKSVMNLLVKLSNGWRPKKVKADPVCESDVQIVKQYKVEGRYVICTNDIMKESVYTQVLKIWDVVPLEDVSKLVKRLDNIYGAFTDDFLSHCKERGLEGELEVPRTWSNSLDIVRLKSNYTESASASAVDLDGTNYAENAKVSESLLLMKFYSLSAGIVGHLLSDSDGKALDLPFEVTDEESQIILHQKSSFILGRSGTGKTTVLTMKLYQKEQLHHMALEGVEVNGDPSTLNVTPSDGNGENENVLRQLFVTVSPKLCHAIKQHVSHLKSFARNEISSDTSGPVDADYVDDDSDQFDGIPDSFSGVPPKSYPLVLTFNKFLFMLDGTLGSSYFERFHDELNFSYGGNASTLATFVMKRKEVNYEKFSMSYWPHFNSQFTKKLDSSRVFTEIISSIKGGLQVGPTDDGKLSLEDYLQLSAGRTSTLSRQKREMIYDIFLTYERMKAERGEFDLSDFVNDIHRRLKRGRYGGDIIDFVYIDEVQDLTMRQISLFKYICRNVDEGFVFSGDTAQTIARGIDFRFQDVRCLFYKEFLTSERNDLANGRQTRGHISPIFHLSQNFRTHAGILKLGHSVIELIYHFFPHSVDILPPEKSLIFGEAPILLESGSDENAIVTIFGNAGDMGGNLVGFGAEQVILVRDDRVRKEITSYVGKNALVLTVVECKGLEFQDVLLYNFFGSSPLKNQWRVIYEFMKLKNMFDSNLQPSFPNFNPAKHNVLCSELKQLYVAITRTRQRLWICENKEDLSRPMFDYWKKLCAVQVRQLDDSLARAMQVASSPEEWKARGKKLLAVENYEVATMCFERAGDRHWEIYAKAAGLKAAAGRTCDLNPEEASRILRQAAELFESISVYRKAADCFFELKEYDRAGRIYLEQGKESDLKLAGKCFTMAGHYELAADVFAKCNLFSECLLSCTKGKLYDLGLQYIQYWKHLETCGELDVIEQVFLENCALSLHEQDDKTKMMKFVKAFSSEDSMRTFLKNLGCLEELLNLEVELGNFLKAADIARERGELLHEADVLEKGGFFKEACELFMWYTLAGCLWANGTGWPLKKFPEMEELLVKAKASAHNIEPHGLYKTVCTNSLLFLNRNYSLFELKQLLIISQNHGNLRGEIISIKRILDSMLSVGFSKYEQERDITENLIVTHLERISRNKVSVETLVYFWNLWKETVLRIFKFLEVVKVNETKDFGKVGEFCLNYLGVRKLCFGTSTVYVCQYPHAEWMKEVDNSFFKKFGKLVCVDLKHLLAAAHNYWSKELVFTGMKVLKVLENLRKNAWKNPMSDVGKMRLYLHIYEVAKLLFSYTHIIKHDDSKLLDGCINVSISEYFKCVFPLDWRRSVTQNVTLLRETKISKKLLEEVIVNNVPEKGTLTYGQLGRVAMVLLGSPKSEFESLDLVLFHCIKAHAEAQKARLKDSLACKLHIALRDVYDANWMTRDYIFPSCFFYLIDRLMVSLLEFQGSLLITRSSLVEWFIHHEWKTNFGTNVASAGDKSVFLRDTYCLLARMLHQLLMNKRDTENWVKKVGINAKENFPVLLLRLVVLMCLLHLNSKAYKKELFDVLSWTGITSQLPPAFTNPLQKIHKVSVLDAVIRAFNAIEDPLVVVRTRNFHPKLSCNDAIILDIADQNKEDLLKVLFPNKVNTCQDIVSAADNSGNTYCTSFAQMKNEWWVEFQNRNVWEVFDTLKLIENNDEKSWQTIVSNAPKIKVQMDKTHDLMTTAIAMASENNASTDDGQQLKDSMPLIKDGARRLSSGKPVFEYFLSPLLPEKNKTTSSDIQEVDVAEKGNDHSTEIGDNIQMKDDSSAAETGKQQESRQVGEKNQGKGNKKQKPKKKGKKK
ncbi:TPR and ankyrin repeat-containing protein 1 [Bienertia sinuspersici]